MRWATVVAFTLFAACSFAREPSAAPESNSTAQLESKPQDSKNFAEDEDQIVKDSRWHVRLGTISFGAGYSHFSSPYYGPYGFYPYSAYYSGMVWDP